MDVEWQAESRYSNLFVFKNQVKSDKRGNTNLMNYSLEISRFQEFRMLVLEYYGLVIVDDKNCWQKGFFDHKSFHEILQPWAQTVVTGRARFVSLDLEVYEILLL